MSYTTDIADTSIRRKLSLAQTCQVLVVDDDELVRTQLGSLLGLAGYAVHEATSGRDALRLLDTTSCEIVVTDWQMPDMNGLELCRALRMRDADRYTYVLMLSVCNAKGDALLALKAGADDYLIKGAYPEELLARVDVGR